LLELRDPVSSSTHLFMCFWAIFATLLMWRVTGGDRWRRLSVAIFGLSMVLLYFASGLFHGLMLPREQLRFYQKLDQSAIYLLIAGTYTPVMALLLTGRMRAAMLGGIWIMAFAGIGCMWLLPKVPHSATVSIYLGMGWFGMLGIWQYFVAVGWRGMAWALGGAGFYTLGAVFELAKWPVIVPGIVQAHEMLHLCDMVGTYCHFVFIFHYVIVYRPVAHPALPRLLPAPAALSLEG
jgi:hemolysin III